MQKQPVGDFVSPHTPSCYIKKKGDFTFGFVFYFAMEY